MSLAEVLQDLHKNILINYDFDDRLLLVILLALKAGERNIVVRVGEEGSKLSKQDRRECAARVAQEVAWICTTLFALSTHQVQCNPKLSTLNFLKSIFIPNVASEAIRRSDSGRAIGASTGGVGPAGMVGKRQQRRSLSAPLGALPQVVDEMRGDGRKTVQPSPSRRAQNESILGPLPLFSEPTSVFGTEGDHRDDSSAGEDMYPKRPSPERRRSSARRFTLTSATKPRSDTITSGGSGSKTPPLIPVVREANAATKSPTLDMRRGSSTSTSRPTPTIRTGPFASPQDRRSSFANITPTLQTNLARSPRSVSPSASPSIPVVLRSPAPSSSPPSIFSDPFTTVAPSPTLLQPSSPPTLSPPMIRSPSPTKQGLGMGRLASRRASHEVLRRATAAGGTPSAPKVLPQVLILERLERSRPSVQQALLDVLRERRVSLQSNAGRRQPPVSPVSPTVALPGVPPGTDDAASMRTRRTGEILSSMTGNEEERSWDGVYNVPKGFFVIAIVCEDGEEAGNDGAWAGVSRHLFDRFSLSHTISSRAFSFPSDRFTAPPLPLPHPLAISPPMYISPVPIPTKALSSIFLSDILTTYTADLISTLRHHPLLEGRMLTSKASIELILFVKIWVLLSRMDDFLLPSSSAPILEQEVADSLLVGPQDVLSVLMAVVGHRLLMRAPQDEKSIFWGSDLAVLEGNPERERGVEGVVRRVSKAV
ncbi:hypothetical protein T439DRAFT_325961 [Meredithblackwellia eburnea MCA 4105]